MQRGGKEVVTCLVAPGGRQSKRVRSIPPTNRSCSCMFIKDTDKAIDNRCLKTHHQSQETVAVVTMLCRQNRQQLHKNVQILWRDLSYAYAGNDLGEDETGQNTDPRRSDSRSEGWILCYPYGCCANVSILVQYLEFEL